MRTRAPEDRLRELGFWVPPDPAALGDLGPLTSRERTLLLRGVGGAAGVANPFFVEVTSAGLTTSITTYTSGDQLGTEITCAVNVSNNTFGVVTALTLLDYAKVIGAAEMRFFYDTTTPASDNSAASWSDADMNKVIAGGLVSIPAPIVDTNNATAAVPNLWIMYRTGSTHANLYLDLVTRSNNAVFAAVGDLHVKIGGFYFS